MDPIAKMMDEHRHILQVLEALERYAAKVEREGKIDPSLLGQFVDFIANFADAYHHAKEEDVLFKHMELHGFSRQMGPVAVMLYEHDQGRSLVAQMRQAAQDPPGAPEAIQRVVRSIRDYIALLRQHIYKEDHILYPMAQTNIPPADMEAFKQEFRQVEERKVASGEPNRLMNLKETLIKAV